MEDKREVASRLSERFNRTAKQPSCGPDFEVPAIEQQRPRTLLSSFLHNCQHGLHISAVWP